MDGQTLFESANAVKTPRAKSITTKQQKEIVPSRQDIAESMEQEMAKKKADIKELQRISKIVSGNKLHFDLNKELNTVVISVIDKDTEQIIRQIPSEDMQKLKLRIRQATGSLFDELV